MRHDTPSTWIRLGAAILVATCGALGCGTDYDPPSDSVSNDRGDSPRTVARDRDTTPHAEATVMPEAPAVETTPDAVTDLASAPDTMLGGIVEDVIEPAADPHAAYLGAERDYYRHEYDASREQLLSSIAARDDFAPAHYLLGLTERKLGHLESSLDAFDDAIALAPGLERAHVNRARVMIDLGRPADALDGLTRVEGDSDAASNVRGLAYMDLGRLDEATAAFEEATALDPTNVYAWNNLGLTRIRLGDFEGAVAPLETAATLPDAPAYVFNNLGIASERVGDLAGAELAYVEAVNRGHAHAGTSRDRVTEAIAYLASIGAPVTLEANASAGDPGSGDVPDGDAAAASDAVEEGAAVTESPIASAEVAGDR